MAASDVDFIDAIAHATDRFVLCLGRFVATSPMKPSSYRGVEIFYKSTLERTEDVLTTYAYLFRFDTDCHWTTRTLPGMNTRWGRRLFGGLFLGSTNLLQWSETLRPLFKLQKHPPVVTDVFIPEREVDAFYDWYEEAVGFYPLWIVPYRMPCPYAWLRPERCPSALYFDFSIYGLPNERPDLDYSRLIEHRAFRSNGIKTLIGQNHYDELTFWAIYDRARYERVKLRMDPANLFRTVYEKLVAPQLARVSERQGDAERYEHPKSAESKG